MSKAALQTVANTSKATEANQQSHAIWIPDHRGGNDSHLLQFRPAFVDGGRGLPHQTVWRPVANPSLAAFLPSPSRTLGWHIDDASAAALQATIWWLEGEGANPNNLFSTLVTNRFPNPTANNNGLFGVFALNLWDDNGNPAQDQLILGRGGQFNVPDGGTTVMLLGGALSVLGMARRYLKS